MTEEKRAAGRPAETMRLRDLDPHKVGEEVVRLVHDHMIRLAMLLDPTSPIPAASEVSSLRCTAQLLVGYAQVGLRATDWPHHGCARDAVQEVCEALYTMAGRPGTFGVGPLEPEEIARDAEPDDAIAIALLAAWARVQLDNREPVSVRALSTLAGLAPKHLYAIARKGELAIDGGAIEASEALRWLSARGVEGVTSRDWWVVGTALCPPTITLEDRATGDLGVIENYTEAEWRAAFGAPSRPYRWVGAEPARVVERRRIIEE